MAEAERATFDEWAIVEVMGHLKLAGRVSEAALFGTALCRVDVYVGDAERPAMTRMFGGSSIYCVTPCDEATARAFALGHQPGPVARWELPAPEPPAQPSPRRLTCRECGEALSVAELQVGNGYCANCGDPPDLDDDDGRDDSSADPPF